MDFSTMDEDPFASIIDQCKISSSQEQKLRNCHFTNDRVEEETSPCSVEPTGILMVSPPESSRDDGEEEDDFHTPPVQPRSQSMSSSEDQGPTIGAVHPQVIRKNNGRADGAVLSADGDGTDAEMAVDLGKDLDTFGFSEMNLLKEIDSGEGVTSVESDHPIRIEEKLERQSKKHRLMEVKYVDSTLKKDGGSKENVEAKSPNVYSGDTEPIMIESEDIEIGATEVIDVDFEENCERLGARLTENVVNVDELEKGANGGDNSASKSIEDLDKLKYVSGGMERIVSRKRELPGSFKEPKDNEGLWVPRQPFRSKMNFRDLCDAVKMVVDDSTDTDFLRTAKVCGLSFHRPRWWPPEGLDDQLLDKFG